MVSYYNPATAAVAMFGRSGSGYHHHPHHSPQNHPYFTPGAYGAGYHHHNPHSNHAGHPAAAAAAGGSGGAGSPVGGGFGVGAAALPGGVTSTQFSPSMTTDFNCNHQYNHFGNMTPDPMTVAAAASPWATQSSMYNTACAAAAVRIAAGLSSVAPPPPHPHPSAPHGASYEEWSNSALNAAGGHPHHHMHPHAYQHHNHHPSFYNHHSSAQQSSPPSSTPSSPSSSHSPSQHNVYSTSSTTPNNSSSSNNNNNSTPFKTEFGPCSGGNNQDASSQEMQQTNQGNSASVSAVTSVGPTIGTPHSPDSGMAISDGVSSSGSPATNNGQQFHPTQHCLGGPSSNSSGSSSTNHSSNNANNNNPGGNNGSSVGASGDGSQSQFASSGGNMIHSGMGGSHHNHHGHDHLHNMTSNHQSSGGNLSHHHHHSHHQALASSHQNGIVNVTSSGRPTQARSPYEWMKKPTYSCSSSGSNPPSNNAKTRTKDKYRVVYSDTQRLELEKEFHYSRYITIRRKAELASILGLSERQVKIWFQNRRAKERKVQRKREEMHQREKLATMVHMQNAAVAAVGGMGGPMCNQAGGGGVSLPVLM